MLAGVSPPPKWEKPQPERPELSQQQSAQGKRGAEAMRLQDIRERSTFVPKRGSPGTLRFKSIVGPPIRFSAGMIPVKLDERNLRARHPRAMPGGGGGWVSRPPAATRTTIPVAGAQNATSTDEQD